MRMGATRTEEEGRTEEGRKGGREEGGGEEEQKEGGRKSRRREVNTLEQGDLVSEIDTCLQYQQLGGRAQAHQIAPHFVSPQIVG